MDAWPIILQHAFYRETDSRYAVGRHLHTVDQWYLVMHGRVRMQFDDASVDLGPEESVLIPAGMPRAPACAGKAPGYLVVIFENRGLDLSRAYRARLTLPSDLRTDLRALVAELRHPGERHTNELLKSLIVRMLIGLERSARTGAAAEAVSPLNAKGRGDVVARVERFMTGALNRPLSRADMAEAVNLSEAHLARVFRAATGRTLLDRLTELRIEQAKRYLLESNLPITHISLEVGFNSFSHFTKLFKRMVGVSPSDYRATGGQSYTADAAATTPTHHNLPDPCPEA